MNWLYVVLAYGSLFCLGIIDNSRGPVFPQILVFFNKSNSQGSLVFVLTSISALFVTVSGKYWLKRWGALIGTRSFVLIQAISSFGMGLSGYLNNGFWFLLLCSFLFGISTGGMMISLNILVIRASSVERRMKTFAGLHAMYGIASLLAPLFITFVYRIGLDWRVSFQLIAIFPFLVFIFSFFVSERLNNENSSNEKAQIPVRIKISLAAIFAFCVAAEIAISSRLVLYLTTYKGWEQELSSFYLSIFFALLLLGRLTFSFISFKRSSFDFLIISLISSFLFYLFGFYIHPIGLSICGLTLSFFFPCAMDWLTKEFGDSTDFILPIIMTSTGVMLIIMHWLVGLLSEKVGIHRALHIGPVCLAISLFFLFISNRLRRRYKNTKAKRAFV